MEWIKIDKDTKLPTTTFWAYGEDEDEPKEGKKVYMADHYEGHWGLDNHECYPFTMRNVTHYTPYYTPEPPKE